MVVGKTVQYIGLKYNLQLPTVFPQNVYAKKYIKYVGGRGNQASCKEILRASNTNNVCSELLV